MTKNNRLIRSAILISLLCTAPLASVELYEEKKVSEIQVELDCSTNYSFDPKPILNKLKTKEGDDFSQFTFDNDLKSLSEEYDRVEPSIRVTDEQVYITIRVCPRPTIHQIRFVGNSVYSSSTLQSELDIKPYTLFNRQEFNKAFNKLKEYYIKRGYFESQLTYSVEPIDNSNEVDIVIDVKEGKSGNIRKIVFKGFKKSEQTELSETMYLKKYNFFTSWLTGSGKFREEALEQDRMTIVNYLHNRGYADARVDIEILDDPESDKIIVEISADRGELYHFGAIKVEGNSLLSSADILKRLQIHENDTFSPDKLRDSSQSIKDFYGQKGYIEASVQYETRLKEDAPIFDVDFYIEEGQQYKIGMVHVFGNQSTKNNVILRESLLVPGETFDSRKLKATQQRLEAIGYFKSVNVYAVRTTDDLGLGDNYRDVYIEVEETTTGNVSLFMGFSSVDDVFGGLDLTERNFNIAGVAKALTGNMGYLRGGGQFFHARGTLGKKQDNILLSWMNPYVNDSLWRLGVELSRTYSELQENTETRTYGGSLFTNYPLSTYWTAGMRQRIRHTFNTIDLKNPPGDNEEAQRALQEELERNEAKGLLSAFSGNLAYDSTDSSYKPHRGWRSYFEAEISGVGGRYDFFKLSYLNSIYFPITARGTLKIRGEIKMISPFGGKSHEQNVPYSERFFLGGEGTVRGYKPLCIGPKIITFYNGNGTLQPKVTETPKGGLSSTLLSAEYNYEVFRMLDVFAFFDAGSVAFSTWTVDTFRCAVGAGVRLEINRGTPIVLGYGYPINPAIPQDKQKFFFSMGGQF